MQSVTERNTKKEILSAYQNVLNDLKTSRQKRLPTSGDNGKAVARALDVAQKCTVEDIVKDTASLKLNLNNVLSNLEKELVSEKEKLNSLTEAIKHEESLLKEVHEIVREADSHKALILTQELEKEKFQKVIEITRENWAKEMAKHNEEIKERDRLLTLQRKRDLEEFNYKQKIEKEHYKTEFEDLKKTELKKLNEEIEAREKVISSKEEQIQNQEKEIKDLKETVDAFPTELETKIAQAVKTALDSEKRSKHFEVSSLKKDHEKITSVLGKDVENLTEKVEALEEINTDLRNRLETAQSRVQEIAAEAIKGAQQKNYIVQPENNSKK